MDNSLLQFLDKGGVLALLVFVIIAGFRGWFVFKTTHDRIVGQVEDQLAAKTAEAEEWKRMALIQGGLLKQTVDRTSEIVRRVVVEADERVRDA